MDQAALEKLLTRSWRHSQEEDDGHSVVYRPDSYSFPRARGRRGMQLKSGGELVETGPGPTDRTQTAVGSWTVEAGPEPTLHLQRASGESQAWRVQQLDEERLILAPV